MIASLLTKHLVTVSLTWGAVNEWTTQAGYLRLAKLADHPTLTTLVQRIAKQEGRHIDFYMTEATRRLRVSTCAQRLPGLGDLDLITQARSRHLLLAA